MVDLSLGRRWRKEMVSASEGVVNLGKEGALQVRDVQTP
jgi:hypothetical protein